MAVADLTVLYCKAISPIDRVQQERVLLCIRRAHIMRAYRESVCYEGI